MNIRMNSLFALTLALVAAAQPAVAKDAAPKAAAAAETIAVMKTSLGEIKIRLFPDKAPKTVENFIGLATGKKEWTDPRSGKKSKKPLYDGTIFHRVIPNFMAQGGDPLGQGIGGPGYTFQDEFHPDLKFDKPGYLAMANSGPGTNGSQFFITVAATAWLTGRHTIFGEVVEGMEVVNKMVAVPRNAMDKPNTDIVIQKIEIREAKKK